MPPALLQVRLLAFPAASAVAFTTIRSSVAPSSATVKGFALRSGGLVVDGGTTADGSTDVGAGKVCAVGALVEPPGGSAVPHAARAIAARNVHAPRRTVNRLNVVVMVLGRLLGALGSRRKQLSGSSCPRSADPDGRSGNMGPMNNNEVPSVTVDQLPELTDDIQLIDVREDDEWAAGRAAGAVHIPLGDLPSRVGEVNPDATVYVICRSGGRSGRATEWLVQNGIDAFNVEGGMKEYATSDRVVLGDSGEPTII